MSDIKNIQLIANLKMELSKTCNAINVINNLIHVIITSDVCKEDIKDWYLSLEDNKYGE